MLHCFRMHAVWLVLLLSLLVLFPNDGVAASCVAGVVDEDEHCMLQTSAATRGALSSKANNEAGKLLGGLAVASVHARAGQTGVSLAVPNAEISFSIGASSDIAGALFGVTTVAYSVGVCFFAASTAASKQQDTVDTRNLEDIDEPHKWAIILCGMLLLMTGGIGTYLVVVLQVFLQERLDMSLIQYNDLIAFRASFGVISSVVVPFLRRKCGSTRLMLGAGGALFLGSCLQVLGVVWIGYYTLLLSGGMLEFAYTTALIVSSSISTRIARGSQLSRVTAVATVSVAIGMVMPMTLMPALVQHMRMPIAFAAVSSFVGVVAVTSSLLFFRLGSCVELDGNGDFEDDPSRRSVAWQAYCLALILGFSAAVGNTFQENFAAIVTQDSGTGTPYGSLGVLLCLVVGSYALAAAAMAAHDKVGWRPVSSLIGFCISALALALLVTHRGSIGVVCVLCGIGRGMFQNATASCLALATPSDRLYIVFSFQRIVDKSASMVLPPIYAWFEQGSKHTAGLTLLSFFFVVMAIFIACVATYDFVWCSGVLFGIKKIDECINVKDAESLPSSAAPPCEAKLQAPSRPAMET